MKVFKKIMNGLGYVESAVQVIIGIVITAVAFANVLARYVFHSRIAFTEELTVNIFVLMIMCGCALCARDGGLISLSLIYDLVGKTGKKIMACIFTLFNLFFYGILAWSGWRKVISLKLFEAHPKLTESLKLPEGLFYVAIPLGAVLLIIHSVEYLVDVLTENAACMKQPEKKAELPEEDAASLKEEASK
ncbi:MAG: TRAP transporter small permease [Oscillospiraceae bacterium]|nr:TRAP transporter small permease [Oscillospiraceae bacterium]